MDVLSSVSPRICQVKHRRRWAQQQLFRPQIAIVGGYHYGNLGDMLLGETTQAEFSAASGIPTGKLGLQTIYNLEKWPKSHMVIVGGGAVITNDSVSKLRERVSGDGRRLSVIGIDVLKMDFSIDNIEFLKSLPYLSARSKEEAEKVRQVGITNCRVMPDIVLAHRIAYSEFKYDKSSRVGINVVPTLRGEDTARSTGQACASYRNFLRDLSQEYIKEGREVVHVPFTPRDDRAAREIFHGINIKFCAYSSNFTKIIRDLGACGTLIPSRFHALILSILLDVPFVPFLYTGKSERLLKDYFSSVQGVTVDDLISCSGRVSEMNSRAGAVLVDRAEVMAASDSVRHEFARLANALGLQK